MAEVITMPRLSDTMEEGTVAKWHKKVGDKVSEGDLLAEIETDKATMDFEAFQEGTLLHIGVQEGETAAVDSILAILGEKGEDISGHLKGEKGGSGDTDKKGDSKSAKDLNQDKEEEKDSGNKNEEAREKSGDVKAESTSDNRLKASPLARKLAADKNIELSKISGSGEGGRIIKRDIENYKPAASAAVSTISGAEEEFDEMQVSQMRKTIAKRLAESKFTAPHFYLTLDVDMDGAIAARKAINEMLEEKISFNDLVIKACAVALKKHPAVNSSWLGNKIRQNKHVHIGVAVAVEDGLLVPVIRHADLKGLSSINSEVKDLAGKARNKQLQPKEWEGNTFTISNLGMFGIEEFTAIINPPDSCILAVGAIKEVPVVKNGAVVPGNVMRVTLSCDHRVVDGATGAAFLQTLKGLLENPVGILAFS